MTFTSQASGTGTIGHGLGVAPRMIIAKTRGVSDGWYVYNANLGAGNFVRLDTTGASAASSTLWNNTSPTSSVFSVGSGFAGSNTYVAYCFSQVAGYSAFGSYTGNGSTDGPFVYLGFRPRYLMIKAFSSGTAERWLVYDTARDPFNAISNDLVPNTSAAEAGAGSSAMDLVSNGFKIRSVSSSAFNANGFGYIYMAFAETPFNYANAR